MSISQNPVPWRIVTWLPLNEQVVDTLLYVNVAPDRAVASIRKIDWLDAVRVLDPSSDLPLTKALITSELAVGMVLPAKVMGMN